MVHTSRLSTRDPYMSHFEDYDDGKDFDNPGLQPIANRILRYSIGAECQETSCLCDMDGEFERKFSSGHCGKLRNLRHRTVLMFQVQEW